MTDYDVAKAVHTHTADQVTDVTTFARGLLTGSTDATSFRTAIGAGTGSGSSAWGAISGTLSSQSDLSTALNAKVSTSLTIAGIALSGNVTAAALKTGIWSAGILKTDLAAAVQTSLGKADTALQSVAAATTSAAGIVPLATNAQATTGTDTSHAVTPAALAAALGSAPVSTAQQTAIDLGSANASGRIMYGSAWPGSRPTNNGGPLTWDDTALALSGSADTAGPDTALLAVGDYWDTYRFEDLS